MLNAVIGALRINLGMNSAAFKEGATEADRRLAKMAENFEKQGRRIKGFGAVMTVAFTAPFVALATKGVAAQRAQEEAVAALDAALASMGDAAGFTSEQLQDMASELQRNSLFGDEEILTKVTANLLTFGNVSGDVFARAQASALDLSARLGSDLQSSVIMLGKALNDPIKGVAALAEVGVSLSTSQQQLIKDMAAAGDMAGAQGLILDELEKQYKGQAAALAATDSGKITQAIGNIGDAFEKIGAVILPVVASIAEQVSRLAIAFQNLSPQTQKIIVVVGALVAAIGPLAMALGSLMIVASGFGVAMAVITSPVTLVIAGLAALAASAVALYRHWDDLLIRFPVLKSAVDGLSEALKWLMAGFEKLSNLRGVLSEGMANLARDMTRWGGDVIDGFVKGLKDRLAAVKDSVTGLAGDVSGWFKDKLGIRSPSRVFIQHGKDVVAGLVQGITGGAKWAEFAATDLGKKVGEAAKEGLAAGFDGFVDALTRGDARGGFQSLIDGLRDGAGSAFGTLLKDAFSGGGLASITGGLKAAFSGVGAGLKSVFTGGGLGAFGSVFSAAMPILGAVQTLVGLFSSFSSKTLLGNGLKIGFDGNGVKGGTFETWKKSTFWGLVSRTSTSVKAFEADMAAAFDAQAHGMRDAVAAVYKSAGVSFDRALIDGFDFAIRTLKTKGLDEAEIQDKIAALFGDYGDALSDLIGGVGLVAASTFANVKNLLAPVGQGFLGTFKDMADAAGDVMARMGGFDNLASGVSGFIASFFSEAEQSAMVLESLKARFADLGLAMPQTLAGFRELVMGQDLMTQSGRETYAALIQVSDQFAALNGDLARLDAGFEAAGAFSTQFDAKLDQIATARGYATSYAAMDGFGGASQIGQLVSLRASMGASTQLMQKITGFFERWDANGMPEVREF